jgi:hypothetical protein
MSQDVWVSLAMKTERNIWGFETDHYTTNQELALKAEKENNKGLALPQDHFPRKIFAREFDDEPSPIKELPSVFHNGFTFVSDDIAHIIAKHDVGNCKTYPVEVYQRDRTTKVPGTFRSLNFGNVKNCFVLEGSKKLRTSNVAPGSWYQITGNLEDEDLRVNSAALSGPDIWIDPILLSVFFLSGDLAEELIKAGHAKDLALTRCLVV